MTGGGDAARGGGGGEEEASGRYTLPSISLLPLTLSIRAEELPVSSL